MHDNSPVKLKHMLCLYSGSVEYVLWDVSGGNGIPLEISMKTWEFLEAITSAGFPMNGVGVAGGLGPDNLDRLKPLVMDYDGLSIDAQKGLRDENNNLDMV